ncbi:threonine synthase [Peptococcaceae bacterium SCADC1_2_3]|nr:threonine synthase [Peptococcaceae bacterium SCADC1_2_3]KFI36587.1 threonine synthase [Peptococcaceae bacterium SCADC1_2_3]KFI37905.1 threonine synthase [Peptococcaceae bacterium SCADC1_2_3]HBQ28489.1 threonine synthase [Desulfotomaculum sp.]
MSYVRTLRCRKCGREYPLGPVNLCDFCFSPLEVNYDYKSMAKDVSVEKITGGPSSIWRYRDLLPANDEIVDLGTGFTPLTLAANLGRELGLTQLYLKNDCLNPTYSFKDRAVSVAVTKAQEFGFTTLACASTGNLAASVAAHAAKAGLKAYVFLTSDVEPEKLVGIAVYNPTMVAVEGSYDQVNRLCGKIVEKYHWGFININLRPYYAEGSKTLGFEVAEQLGWRAPDCIVAPAASGLLFTRIYKGLEELSLLGLIGSVNTHMYLAQAAGCSPIVNAFQAGSQHVHPVKPDTIAKSIAIGNPADGYYALRVARQSGGGACAVTDEELVAGMKLLAQTEGIFAEAVGGVVIAGLKKLVASGVIKRDELTVVFLTGAGLKTQEAVADVVQPLLIQPTPESFEEVLGEQKINSPG